jgi:hypothetical protein
MKLNSPADLLETINQNTKAFESAVRGGDKGTARHLVDENITQYNRLARLVPLRQQFYRGQAKEWEAKIPEIAAMPEPGMESTGTGLLDDTGIPASASTPVPAAPKRTHQVFISYSSPDRAIANDLCTYLEGQGIACWIAPRDVVPGANFPGSIIDAIDASRIMVLIFSKSSNDSPHVFRELTRAVTHKILIVPFRIDEILPSKNMDYLINVAQWLDGLPPPPHQHFGTLLETLKTHLALQPAGNPETKPGGG